MQSSCSPVIVEFKENGTFYLATGATGGSKILSSTAFVLSLVLDRGMGVRQAGKEKRLHDQLVPDEVSQALE